MKYMKNKKTRLVCAVLAGILGSCVAMFAISRLSWDISGWVTVTASSAAELNTGSDFEFSYELGSSSESAKEERKSITEKYTEVMEKAEKLFDAYKTYDDVVNVCTINESPNKTVRVDPELYHALAEVVKYDGASYLYLGPVYASYRDMMLAEDDDEAKLVDPAFDNEKAGAIRKTVDMIREEDSISLELLDDEQVCLHVSEEYLALAKETHLSTFIDFAWMKNAFIADLAADELTEAGYTHGSIVSYDGFGRCLDDRDAKERDADYTLQIYDHQKDMVFAAGTFTYQGPKAFAMMQDYAPNHSNTGLYYTYEDGRTQTLHFDPATGEVKESIGNLLTYSSEADCGRLALAMAPVFISEEFDYDKLADLTQESIYSIYCVNHVICHTDPEAVFVNLLKEKEVTYTVE